MITWRPMRQQHRRMRSRCASYARRSSCIPCRRSRTYHLWRCHVATDIKQPMTSFSSCAHQTTHLSTWPDLGAAKFLLVSLTGPSSLVGCMDKFRPTLNPIFNTFRCLLMQIFFYIVHSFSSFLVRAHWHIKPHSYSSLNRLVFLTVKVTGPLPNPPTWRAWRFDFVAFCLLRGAA